MNVKSLIATVAVASASELMETGDYQFMQFVSEYSRSYGTKAEFEFRSTMFKNSLAQIEEHNSVDGQTSTVGINFMSDWTTEEKKKLTGYTNTTTQDNLVILDETKLAASVDWRDEGAVTHVKNQGQCGSCWAFSTTGAVEGADFIQNHQLQTLSEQQLVDCSKKNSGCQGGLMDLGFQYIIENGIQSESSYPYHARGGRCKFVPSKSVASLTKYADVGQSAGQLKAALNIQPVAVAIEADQYAFQAYTGGILTQGCGENLDHGVLAVGYGTDTNGVEFITVKNSWGPSWGVGGYIKMAPNQCGVTKQASRPIV